MLSSPLLFTALVFITSAAGGALGSLVGLGGGFIIVPVLTLLLHVPLKYAVGAGLIAVICSSANSSALLLRNGMPHLRIATFLEAGSSAGAFTGVILSQFISSRILYVLFAGVLLHSAASMYSLRVSRKRPATEIDPPSPWSEYLHLSGEYYDLSSAQTITYEARRPGFSLLWMYFAGILSALLGIGSGVLKVPAMDRIMRLPMKVSSATSNLMVGVTTAGSALAYLRMGHLQPILITPVAGGVLLGSFIGTRFLIRAPSESIRKIFIALLIVLGTQMLWKGFQ